MTHCLVQVEFRIELCDIFYKEMDQVFAVW